MLNLSKKEWEHDKKNFESLKDLLKDLKLLLSSEHSKDLKENKQNLNSEELEDLLTILK